MSNKDLVSDLLSRLPDDVSLQQIAREVEFVAGVREGLAQLDRGEGTEVEEVEKLIESWTTKWSSYRAQSTI
jgi:predicted transcriptional regulator